MSELVIPVVSKYRLGRNEFKKLYMCPGDKSHGIVDITMHLDVPTNNKGQQLIGFYLSDSNSLTSADPKDMIFDKVIIGIPEVSPELGKIIVGPNQNLYASLIGDGPVNIRVSGLEEKNSLVKKAGRLSGLVINKIGVHELYRVDNPLTSYGACTLSINNFADGADDEIIVWVTDNVEVKTVNDAERMVDRVARIKMAVGETVFIENMTLAPNERVYVSTKTKGVAFTLNGLLVGAV